MELFEWNEEGGAFGEDSEKVRARGNRGLGAKEGGGKGGDSIHS